MQGQGCYDYLVVKNKKNTTRLCGNKNPGVMMSTSNEMYIEFVSDNSMSKKGFEAEYRTGTVSMTILIVILQGSVVQCWISVNPSVKI